MLPHGEKFFILAEVGAFYSESNLSLPSAFETIFVRWQMCLLGRDPTAS